VTDALFANGNVGVCHRRWHDLAKEVEKPGFPEPKRRVRDFPVLPGKALPIMKKVSRNRREQQNGQNPGTDEH
jgi:hypothetical protein